MCANRDDADIEVVALGANSEGSPNLSSALRKKPTVNNDDEVNPEVEKSVHEVLTCGSIALAQPAVGYRSASGTNRPRDSSYADTAPLAMS